MVGVRGFEPPAPASRRQCSTKLSYTPICVARLSRALKRATNLNKVGDYSYSARYCVALAAPDRSVFSGLYCRLNLIQALMEQF